jgi:imidazolonepropionase-like amidohydrolase
MDLLIRPGAVIDGIGGIHDDVEILVRDRRIDAVRPRGQGEPGPGLEIVEAPGQTAMPGMIDLHMHVFQWEQPHDVPWGKESILDAGVRGVRNASALLDLGVTTARDVASRDNLSIQLRDLINAGVVRGPRFFASGTQLEAAGRAAYFFKAIYVNGPDEARAAARRQVRAGADWIKIMATAGVGGGTGSLISEPGWQELTEEELRAAAEVAHGPGRHITAHAIGNAGIKAAIRAGMDCIEHGSFLDDEAIEMMLERDVSFVPTLIITRNLGEHGTERGFERNIVERAKRTLEAGFESVRKAHAAGVRIGTGSDVDLDETAAQEVRMLIEAGLPPMEALKATTSAAARVLNLQDELGSIEAGKVADIILLDGDPLEDPFALDRVTHVVHDGRLMKAPGDAPPHAILRRTGERRP